MYLSDPLSRLSSHNTQDGNKEEVQGLKVNICDITSVKNVTLDQFKEYTASDEDFKLLKMYVMHGWPSAQQDCVEQLSHTSPLRRKYPSLMVYCSKAIGL